VTATEPAPEQNDPLGPRRTPPATGAPIPVPERAAADRLDLLATLSRRRSIRTFSDVPVAPRTVLDVVEAGMRADRTSWPTEQGALALEPVVVALRLTDLSPAVYRVDLDSYLLTPVMPLAGPADVATMTLQREFAGAAAIISFAVDLESAAARHGGHGYRLLLGRVGAAAYTAWLEGVARGLVGSVFAGFLPAAVRLPLFCDGGSRQQAFALALGNPPTEAPTSVLPAGATDSEPF
jgi:nitroreductase